MSRSMPIVLVAALALTGLSSRAVCGQPTGDLVTRSWKLEVIELRDGRRLEGLVLAGDSGPPAPDSADVAILQIVRPAGQPMQLIGWPPFPADSVRFVERLPPDGHRELAARVEAFRAGRRRQDDAAAVHLLQTDENGPWRYAGTELKLESTAESMLTREAVVRLELVLGALQALVPPTGETGLVTVRLAGSLAEYRQLQAELGLRIENPAFYLPQRRLLVAGSELSSLVVQRRAADDLLDLAEQQLKTLDATLEVRIRRLASDLETQGMPPAKRAELVRLARQRWSRERGEELARIATARRDNEAVVMRARQTFDARLAHEAWHAYADCRLRPDDAPGLPAWLDEGIAQVVETAVVEAGEVRLDAPDPIRLARLQELLRLGGVPPVADVVTGGQAAFVAGHAGADQAVAYLTAWGLALDLAIIHPVLSAAKVRQLTEAGDDHPLARLESLVEMPVDQFDRQWRERMLAIRAPVAKAVSQAAESAR